VAQGVVEQDADDAGDRVGIADRPRRLLRREDVEVDVVLGRAQVELRGHRAGDLRELDGL
jgi:hypothetical protein